MRGRDKGEREGGEIWQRDERETEKGLRGCYVLTLAHQASVKLSTSELTTFGHKQ